MMEKDKMSRFVSFKTTKTTAYISVDHIVSVQKLEDTLYDDGQDPCDYGIILTNGDKRAIPTECFEKICVLLGIDVE